MYIMIRNITLIGKEASYDIHIVTNNSCSTVEGGTELCWNLRKLFFISIFDTLPNSVLTDWDVIWPPATWVLWFKLQVNHHSCVISSYYWQDHNKQSIRKMKCTIMHVSKTFICTVSLYGCVYWILRFILGINPVRNIHNFVSAYIAEEICIDLISFVGVG